MKVDAPILTDFLYLFYLILNADIVSLKTILNAFAYRAELLFHSHEAIGSIS